MRKVAGYSLTSTAAADAPAPTLFENTRRLLQQWITSKGKVVTDGDQTTVTFSDGRQAQLISGSSKCKDGELHQATLIEPTEGGYLFSTSTTLGRLGNALGVHVELRVGNLPYQLQPLRFEVRCPEIVRNIMESAGDWYVGEVLVTTRPLLFSGIRGGKGFIQIVWHDSRNLPIVAVSSHEGNAFGENLANDLARDLSGLAIVARLDTEAAWTLTNEKGKGWSCYNGAVRVYWPLRHGLEEPTAHPLWTLQRLFAGVSNPTDAARRIRRQLRRRILGLSAFSVLEPTLLRTIRVAARTEETDRLRKVAVDDADWRALAESYAEDNQDLSEKVDDRDQQIRDLQAQIQNLQSAFRWQPEDDEISPDVTTPPTTVADAVDQAREVFAEELVFGEDVETGISGLANDAGPPEKILSQLGKLAELARQLNKGSIGATVVQWLRQQGVEASNESETIRNSGKEMKKRTWHDGADHRQFEMHLKPSDATSPDRCVRIYFAHDEAAGKVIVGWVGRHP